MYSKSPSVVVRYCFRFHMFSSLWSKGRLVILDPLSVLFLRGSSWVFLCRNGRGTRVYKSEVSNLRYVKTINLMGQTLWNNMWGSFDYMVGSPYLGQSKILNTVSWVEKEVESQITNKGDLMKKLVLENYIWKCLGKKELVNRWSQMLMCSKLQRSNYNRNGDIRFEVLSSFLKKCVVV